MTAQRKWKKKRVLTPPTSEQIKRPRRLNPYISYRDNYEKIDKKEFRNKIKYDPITGDLFRRSAVYADWKPIKRRDFGKHISFTFNKVQVLGQDAAWFFSRGEWPKEKILFKDDNLFNLAEENLVGESEKDKMLGSWRVHLEKDGNYHAFAFHGGLFQKATRFPTQAAADEWGRKQIMFYNKYCLNYKSNAEHVSEERETGYPYVNYRHGTKNYAVYIVIDGKPMYFKATNNIEDAIEAQIEGQREADEIWNVSYE